MVAIVDRFHCTIWELLAIHLETCLWNEHGPFLLPCSQASSDFCSSVCIQYNTRKWKSGIKTKRPGNTYRVSISKIDVEWEGLIFKYVWIIWCIAFTVGSLPPYVHIASTSSFTWWMSTGFASFSLLFRFHVYILNTNRRKKWGRPGNCFCKLILSFTIAAMAGCMIVYKKLYLLCKASFSKSASLLWLSLFNNNNSELVLVLTTCDFNKNKYGYLSVHLHSHLISRPKLHVASNNRRKERI